MFWHFLQDICTFLVKLLTDTKHRGAFEQAFVAFSNLCALLWKTSHPQLHSLPQKILNDILDAVTSSKKSNKTKICATRRSAGVPFIIQAVLTSNIPSSGPLLRSTMKKLISTAVDENTERENKIHCMNILRALFRDAKLGESVGSFIEDGVILAVDGFKSENWAERNSATLLFSALMTRIFGVKREKDNISSKNCLTGKIFFQRHPKLYQYFLNQFTNQNELSSNQKSGVLVLDCALYPILLMLSR